MTRVTSTKKKGTMIDVKTAAALNTDGEEMVIAQKVEKTQA